IKDGGFAEKDPHDHLWLESDNDPLLAKFPVLRDFFNREFEHITPGTLSVVSAIHTHIKPDAGDELCRILHRADGIDSRYDRNNPLVGCEQTQHGKDKAELESNPPPMYRGNVFGHEIRVDPAEMESRREKFYGELIVLLGLNDILKSDWADFANFQRIRTAMRNQWDIAMSDTTRPDNDTSLWEHVYSVSSIGKALHIKRLITGEFDQESTNVFRIWGFGFDSLRYISFSHKLADVVARRQVIQGIFDEAVKIAEFEFPFGNHIYRDENCIFFLTADLDKRFFEALEKRIATVAVEKSAGELLPHFEASPNALQTLTGLSTHIESLRHKTRVPVQGDLGEVIQRFDRSWNGDRGRGMAVCPVCRLRPCSPDENKVCNTCARRRQTAPRGDGQTVFHSEIAGRKRRLALIVARIGLHDWLNGKLVRTTFVTEPHGIEATLKALPAFADLNLGPISWEVHDRLTKPQNAATMRAEFAAAVTDPASQPLAALFYGRGLRQSHPPHPPLEVWPSHSMKDIAGQAAREIETDESLALLNAITAKTPTPSTLLDAWHTTFKFTREVQEKFLPQVKLDRAYVEVAEEPNGLHENEAFDDATIDGVGREVVFHKGKRFWVLGASQEECDLWRGKTLQLDSNRSFEIVQAGMEPQVYLPWRRITASPDLLMLLVPADKALDLTRDIYNEFLAQFGKAYGRLPIAIANIFFPDHLPMFSVLDAARRVERNFHAIQTGVWVKTVPPRDPASLPQLLGENQECAPTDWFHPYMRVSGPAGDDDMETVMGTVRHFSRLSPSDEVLIQPNLYFAGWLGNSAARFDISSHAQSSPEITLHECLKAVDPMRKDAFFPMLLDRLQPDILDAWENLKASHITDSSFRNALQVYKSRMESWAGGEAAPETAAALAAAVLRHPVKSALRDKSLERMALLYLHIMKQHLAEDIG
ncbi:MAG: hypothetical protein M3Z36_12145, partial [Acidobacteriota bacterium]|nr:hypothetical protein [Acidobacteriota bacterium]